MAFFSFGKKDKNPLQPAESVGKTPPGSPPKIQTPPPEAGVSGALPPPPISGGIPAVKMPQTSGLMSAPPMPKNTVTTQPMSMPPRPSAPGAPGQKKATQRLMVTANPGGRIASTAPLPGAPAAGTTVDLPAGMLLRCLPPEMLSASLADFEASGAAGTEVPLPIHSIISQLPSGKVEMPIRDLVAHLPSEFLRPEEEISSQFDNVVNLPLMDVVMRIPPNLLAVRPDQKDVDPNVRRMADPFAGERPVAPPAEARIVEENQVTPTEEFVPQASRPLPRPPIPAMQSTAPQPTATQSTPSFIPPPRNPVVSSAPPLLHQTGSLSGRPGPLRATAPMPGRVLPAENPIKPQPPRPSTLSESQMLGVPRGPLIGATASGPLEPRNLPKMPPTAPPVPMAPVAPPPPSSVAVTAPMPRSAIPTPQPASGPPATDAAELKRLAALAAMEMKEKSAEEGTEEASVPAPSTEEKPVAALPFDPPSPEPLAIIPPPAPDPEKPAFVEPQKPDLKQFAFNAPERPSPIAPTAQLIPPTDRPAPPAAATSRFRLPEIMREAAQTTPITPVSSEAVPTTRTTRFSPPTTFSPPVPPSITESQILPSNPPPATAINLNNCTSDDLMPIPGMTRGLAAAIVAHRDKLGEFHKLEELLDVPGMTRDIYATLTGETPSSGVHPSINELLGFPMDQELSLKDVTDRICCWPDVTGCLLSQKNGLHLVGTAPDFLDTEAIVAFAPRMFEDVNKSFIEITGKQTDELTIPTTGTSFHLLRERDLYMIILSRLPLMPERHLKIARFVLAGLSSRPS